MRKLIWVGPRLSDIQAIRRLFSGAVTIFGGEADEGYVSFEGMNGWRPDHNAEANRERIAAFYKSELARIPEDADLLCYGAEWTYCAQSNRAPYRNDPVLTQTLSDKMRVRLLFADRMPVVPSQLMFAAECTIDRLAERFPSARSFVIQASFGSGGAATYRLDRDRELPPGLLPGPELVVSAFLEGLPVNQHLVVTGGQPVVLPPSIQIVEQAATGQLLYRGGDFAAVGCLGRKETEQLADQSRAIGERLSGLGYRGVAGIDYIVGDGKTYLVEINPRFQASTPSLNAALKGAGLPSVQELHMAAFEARAIPVPSFKCRESFYIFSGESTSANAPVISDEWWQFAPEGGEVPATIEVNAPTHRLQGRGQLVGIFDGEVRVPPLVKNLLKTRLPLNQIDLMRPSDAARLKCEILAYGAAPSATAQNQLGELVKSQAPPGTYNSGLELRLGDSLYVTARMPGRLASMTPFLVDYVDDSFWLVCGGDRMRVDVLHPPRSFFEAQTRSGRPLVEVGQFFTDRLRVYPFRGCRFTGESACRFCEVPTYRADQEACALEDIADTVAFCLNCAELPFHHILVSGGVPPDAAGWAHLVNAVASIRSLCNLPIYVMTVPPPNQVLDDLMDAGAGELGFNMEVYDERRANLLMPAKGRIPRHRYFEVMERAVERLGSAGAVRSVLIPGLEAIESTLEGISQLARRGVMPILSPFTPVSGTELGNFHSLTPEELYQIWSAGQVLAEKHGLGLGPSCIACQNNTLAVPTSSFYHHY